MIEARTTLRLQNFCRIGLGMLTTQSLIIEGDGSSSDKTWSSLGILGEEELEAKGGEDNYKIIEEKR